MDVKEGNDILQVRHVSYRYHGGIQGLSDVTLDIREGEIFAVIGSNGSGKSTLLHVMNGLTPPTSGAVLFRGREVSEKSA